MWVGQIPRSRTAGSNRMHFDTYCQTVLKAVTPSYTLIIQRVLIFLTERADILTVVNLMLKRIPYHCINFQLRKGIMKVIFETLQGFHGRRNVCVAVRGGGFLEEAAFRRRLEQNAQLRWRPRARHRGWENVLPSLS